MEVIFLGTGSNNPSPVRNVSCTCVRIDGESWLFDAGEATQIQLMKSTVKPGKITKIFITHLHGDHIFGLPGLMCTIGQNIVENKKLEVYGPVGLRRYLRTCLELSRSMVTYKYVVHEMVPLEEQIPDDIKWWKMIETDDQYLHPSEILGTQIHANKDGYWHLFENDLISVKSSWIKHKIPCFGFVIEQKPTPGRLDVDGLKAIGITPGPIYKKIKLGEDVVLENGAVVEAKNYIGPSKPGKKLTILGDCFECSPSIINLARNSDLLIHECTLEDAFREKAIAHGHSTSSMAANVANSINAKCLILNHFSQRYKPANYVADSEQSNNDNDDENGNDNVEKLVEEAKLLFKGELMAAEDFFTFKL